MPPIRSALIATDFSLEAGSATNRAASIARETGLQGALVHVLPATLPLDIHLGAATQAQKALTLVSDRLMQEGLQFAPRLLDGDVSAELAQAAREFDMVIAGARGGELLLDLQLGRTTVRLVRQSERPVLVVKRPANEPYRRVLVAVDFSEPSHLAAACGAQIAPKAQFDFVNAFQVEFESTLRLADVEQARIESYRAEAHREATLLMRTFTAGVALPLDQVLPTVTRGHPVSVLLEHAKKEDAQLIVIGKHAAGIMEKILVGSVALQVLGMAECDVLVVPEAAA